MACGTDIGECQIGKLTCSKGDWGECEGEIKPSEEGCDDKDNDCDGTVDEGCSCATGKTRECGVSRGECQGGRQECVNGIWTDCLDSVEPDEEVCDGKDNDCDGDIDEYLECEEETKTEEGREEDDARTIFQRIGDFIVDSWVVVLSVMLSLGILTGSVFALIRFRKFRKDKKVESFQKTSLEETSASQRSPLE
jgi:hypothetical protein